MPSPAQPIAQSVEVGTAARRGQRTPPVYFAILAVAPLVLAQAPPAAGQAYPTRPVTIVVPFAPGGGNDILARLLAQRMGAALGQQFVIENRAGAGGTVGARAVAKARPDGYTLMVVHPSVPVHTVADLIALAKHEPGRINYATAGVGSGSHMSCELFAALADIKLAHVPYRGTGVALNDLLGGHVAMTITTIPAVIGQVRANLLRAVAVTGEARSPILPETPTLAESGVPGYAAVIHYGMVAPAGTDRASVNRLNAELRAALASEEVRARIAEDGGTALAGTPEQQAADIDQEETKWGALVRKLGLRAE